MNDNNLNDYKSIRRLAIRSLFEIIEQSSEGTVIVDKDARIVWINERYARRFGLQDSSLAIGQ
ncbi:PAS domain-containing protein, partial [Pseudomonas viridiflava]|uniref:PAS domain-containing protein n=1 Tax=Pseudomonas viridiflava TaxID=33069 RepID=UPI000F034713